MHLVDHLFILMLFVVQPVYGALEARRTERRAALGEPLNRITFYRQTMLMEWLALFVLFGAWHWFERPLADLGFVHPQGQGFWIGVLLIVVLAAGLLYSWHRCRKSADAEKEKQVTGLGKVAMYLPQSDTELRNFYAVSVTAGIVEEIVYRGFVIWYLSQAMPLWAAVVVSSLLFGAAHSYQGPSGALRCGLLGLALAVFYVGTGSIWLPVVAHILLDALQGGMLRELFRRNETPTPEVSART